MRTFLVLGLGTLGLGTLALAASCGGTAVIDGDGSEGGGGSSQNGNGGTGNIGNASGSSMTSANGGTGNIGNTDGAECAVNGDPTPSNCAGACQVLFCCADPRCSGIGPGNEDEFRAGCEMSCNGGQGMALISVVNGERCDQTVNTIKSVSPEFADTCDNGP